MPFLSTLGIGKGIDKKPLIFMIFKNINYHFDFIYFMKNFIARHD
jgi:hypothetical protein